MGGCALPRLLPPRALTNTLPVCLLLPLLLQVPCRQPSASSWWLCPARATHHKVSHVRVLHTTPTHTTAHGLVKLPSRISPTFARGRSRVAKFIVGIRYSACHHSVAWGAGRPHPLCTTPPPPPQSMCPPLTHTPPLLAAVPATAAQVCSLAGRHTYLPHGPRLTPHMVSCARWGLHTTPTHPQHCTRLSQAP